MVCTVVRTVALARGDDEFVVVCALSTLRLFIAVSEIAYLTFFNWTLCNSNNSNQSLIFTVVRVIKSLQNPLKARQ